MEVNRIDCEPRKFYWSIANLNMWPLAQKKALVSPKFGLDSVASAKFYLTLFPRAIKEGEQQYLSLYLVRDISDYGPKCVRVQFKITVRREVLSTFTPVCSSFTKIFQKGNICGRSNFIERRLLEPSRGGCINDLFVTCEYIIEDDEGVKQSPWSCNLNDLERLSNDFLRVFQNGIHTDLSLRSSDGIIHKAHEIVVSTRFCRFLQDYSKDCLNQEFSLSFDSSTLDFLLQYIYSGKVKMDDESTKMFDALYCFKLPHLQQILFPGSSAEQVVTTIKTKSTSFTWNIPLSCSLSRNTFLIKTFSCDELLDWTKIKISFDIKLNNSKKKEGKFTIHRMSVETPIHMKCKFHFVFVHFKKIFEHDFGKEKRWIIPYVVDIEKTKTKMDNLNIDTLSVSIHIQISDGNFRSEIKSTHTSKFDVKETESNYWSLQEDFKKLYLEPKNTDVKLYLKHEVFIAHKVILCARSPVFSKMFDHDMVEARTNEIILKNVTKEALKSMLSYMYYGELEKEKPKDIADAIDLYEAADQYELLLLKEKCISYFIRVMSAENVGVLIRLAAMHNDLRLKTLVQNFVFLNTNQILSSNEWNQIIEENSEFAKDLQNIIVAAEDLGPPIVMTMLSLLYCGKLNPEDQNMDSIIKFYDIAIKYKLQDLKYECLKFFGTVIDTKNIGELITLADLHKDENLETLIQDFVKLNLDKLINSEEWENMMSVRLDTVADMKVISLVGKRVNISTLMSFLSFIYLGNLGEKAKCVDHLIKIYSDAYKFSLLKMKKECLNLFERVIKAKNLGKLIILSHKCKDLFLKKCITDYVSNNINSILRSKEWKRISRTRPDVAYDMCNINFFTKEIKPKIVLTMLWYIYSGELDKEQEDIESVYELYKYTKQYNLSKLGEECITFFRYATTAENIGKILTLSKEDYDEPLKQCLSTFVSSNFSKILSSQTWKQTMQCRLDLAVDMEQIPAAVESQGPTILLPMLSLIFTGEIGEENTDTSSILKLYETADKFKLFGLKKECVASIKRLLSEKNVGDILLLADTYKDDSLKMCVLDFVCNNAKNLLKSDAWKDAIFKNSRLGCEILMATLGALADK